MFPIVTGLVFALIGFGNLKIGQLHADRPNARLTRGLGFVGIGCGLFFVVVGIAQVAGLIPTAPPQLGR